MKEERRKRKKKKEEKRRNEEERRKKSAAYEADGLQGVPMIHASPPARGGARSAFTQVHASYSRIFIRGAARPIAEPT